MADVTKGSSSQIDEVSSSDGPPTICEPVPGTTNGDSQGSDHGNEAKRLIVTSSTSVKPSLFFPHRTNVMGSNDASSSSSKGTPSRGFVLNPPRLSSNPLKMDSDDESTADESRQSEVSSTPSKAEAKSKGFVLNPPRLSNPFAKIGADEERTEAKSEEKKSEVTSTPTKSEEGVVSSTPRSAVSFVPLGGEPSAHAAPPSLSQASSNTAPSFGFVFGQNIHEKVVEATTTAEAASSTVCESSSSEEVPKEVTTNGTTASEMLFSAHAKKEADKAEKASDSGGKTLSEAAREYEEARAVKRKFEEVQVITGEEEESNVLQINCKLFSWSSSTWVERGRGTLRVNDFPSNTTHHRLIVRSAGSLRVVLNTNIWSGMTVDRASNKSMRITAMDSNEVVKVFLIMASPKEMDQLQKCLEWRVNNLKKNEPVNHKKVKDDDKPLPPALDDKLYTF
uniref:Ran-binding protein 3 n=2 Tax=Lygus hesperus TaxID=30085 RepID=A0A146LK58_LYGHE